MVKHFEFLSKNYLIVGTFKTGLTVSIKWKDVNTDIYLS